MNRELTGLLVLLVSCACSSTPPAQSGGEMATPSMGEQAAPPAGEQEATPAAEAETPPAAEKTTPPVEVKLSTDKTTGRVVATAELTATADLPRVLARFVVPAGVTLVDGVAEVEVGKLANGERRSLSVTLEVPAEGQFLLAAGADLFMEPGVKLHRSATLNLGTEATRPPAGDVVRTPGGTGIRLSPAKKR